MNRLSFALAVATVFLHSSLFAQAPAQPAGPAGEALAAYNRVKPNILKAAEAVPTEDYSYKPLPDIRTFARVVTHVTEAQMHTCSALAGTTYDPKSLPGETAGKDAIVAALKASFDLCDKAYAGLSTGELLEVLTLGPVKRSRLGLAWGNVSHDNEQYATLALYMRMKGLTPPSAMER